MITEKVLTCQAGRTKAWGGQPSECPRKREEGMLSDPEVSGGQKVRQMWLP